MHSLLQRHLIGFPPPYHLHKGTQAAGVYTLHCKSDPVTLFPAQCLQMASSPIREPSEVLTMALEGWHQLSLPFGLKSFVQLALTWSVTDSLAGLLVIS